MFRIGKLLGSGVHGQVFNLSDDTQQVIKIAWAPTTAQFTFDNVFEWTFEHVEKIYKYLLKQKIPALAQVSHFETLLKEDDKQYYAALIEKLFPLTEDEYKVFKSICLEYNGSLDKGVSLKHIEALQDWLIFDKIKIIDFYHHINSLPVTHRDFHRRNIMKDKDGNFKLIDFELLVIKETDVL